jgi:hypothetical protein
MTQLQSLFAGKAVPFDQDGLDIVFGGEIAARDDQIYIAAYDYNADQSVVCVLPSPIERPRNTDLKSLMSDRDFLLEAFEKGKRVVLDEHEAEQNLNAALIEQIQPKLASP